MLNTEFYINKSFKEQVESNLTNPFSSTKKMPIIIVLIKYNTRATSLFFWKHKEPDIQGIVQLFIVSWETMYVLIIRVLFKLKFMLVLQIKDLKTQHTILFFEF